MTNFTKSEENYIAHEVQLRLHSEQFKINDQRFDRLENKLNVIIGIAITSVVLTVLLHWFNLI